MKNIQRYIIAVLASVVLFSCETEITVDLPQSRSLVVIDAWINNKPEQQTIKVMRSIPYFQDSFLPGLNEASVKVTDITDDVVYDFVLTGDEGEYVWNPTDEIPNFGVVGNEYILSVQLGGNVYESYSKMNRVPPIDSIQYRFEEGNSFFPDSYFAGFYATDPQGPGDTYWIKAWKNGEYLNKPSEINISYDAGGSPGAVVDGIVFIQPVRDGINPFDQNDDNEFLPPYEPGDSVYVELHAINNDAYAFLSEVITQTNRPGGFGELFAQPLANVPSNIVPAGDVIDDTEEVLGFFNISAVTSLGRRLDANDLPAESN